MRSAKKSLSAAALSLVLAGTAGLAIAAPAVGSDHDHARAAGPRDAFTDGGHTTAPRDREAFTDGARSSQAEPITVIDGNPAA